MMVIRSIGPLAALTAPQQEHVAELIESLSEHADFEPPVADWRAQALVVYSVFETEAARGRSQRLVVAPASEVLAPGDAVVSQGWTAVMAVSATQDGRPVETDEPDLAVSARLVRERA